MHHRMHIKDFDILPKFSTIQPNYKPQKSIKMLNRKVNVICTTRVGCSNLVRVPLTQFHLSYKSKVVNVYTTWATEG